MIFRRYMVPSFRIWDLFSAVPSSLHSIILVVLIPNVVSFRICGAQIIFLHYGHNGLNEGNLLRSRQPCCGFRLPASAGSGE